MSEPRRIAAHPSILLPVLIGLLIAAGLAATFIYLRHDLAAARAVPENNTRNLVKLLDEHVGRTLDAADLVLRLAQERAHTGGLKEVIDDSAAFIAMVEAAPHLDNLYILDERGRAVFDARGKTALQNPLSDREWVRSLLSSSRAGMFIGRAAFDPATHHLSFPVGRILSDGQGRMIGIAASTIPLDYFESFHLESDLGAHTVLGISSLDGVNLVRLPATSWELGAGMASDPLFTVHLPRSPQGTYWSGAEEDGMTVSYRTLADRRLVVWIGIESSDAVAAHAERARVITLGVLGFSGLLLALMTLLLRETRNERNASRKLVEANQELSRSNADLEQFAYIASHDLKEPLRNIASYVQLLQRRYQGRLDDDADAFIGYTVDGVRRMQMIINELLSYSRIGSAGRPKEIVQIGVLVSAVLSDCKTMITEAEAVFDIKGPLPAVLGDPVQLSGVLMNLVVNALKYRRDDVRPEVTISAAETPEGWRIDVADNGIGIEPAYHSQIFDLFKRLHARDSYSGSGIGLAVCRRVIEHHNGRIWVDSVPGRGSVFRFTLPKAP